MPAGESLPETLDGIRRGVVTVEPYRGGWLVRGAVGDLLISTELENAGAIWRERLAGYHVKKTTENAAAFASAAKETRKVKAVLALRGERVAKAGTAITDTARNRLQKRASREIKAIYQQAIAEYRDELKAVIEQYTAASDPVEAFKLAERRGELEAVINSLSNGLANAGSEAANAVSGLLPETRGVARSIAAWEVDMIAGQNVSRMLGNRAAAVAVTSRYSKVKYSERELSKKFIADMMGRNKYDRRAWANIQSRQKAEKALRQAVSRGVLTGEHPYKIAKRIENVFNQWENRSKVIARTETARVMSASLQEFYAECNAAGVGVLNRWEATLDSRTRKTHRKVDGETRPVGEKFSNGCIRPGEGSAAEAINCRCCLVPILDGFKPDWEARRDNETGKLIPYMSYSEWEKWKETEQGRAFASGEANIYNYLD